MPIVPVLKPDLFELANNQHWRVEFGVRNWTVPAPAWMKLPGNGSGTDTEEAWTHYGFETYYALLNCGFRLKPTAGTANGVHPVPLGFSRVYVHCEGGFSYEKWMKGLGEGRSFVTTGPLALGELNNQLPGTTLKFTKPTKVKCRIEHPGLTGLVKYEWVVNGKVASGREYGLGNTYPINMGGGRDELELTESGWAALRCAQKLSDGRLRFAHTAPWWVEIEGQPLRPQREQADWFVQRTEEEIARNTGVLSTEQLAEFHEALAAWKKIQATAR